MGRGALCTMLGATQTCFRQWPQGEQGAWVSRVGPQSPWRAGEPWQSQHSRPLPSVCSSGQAGDSTWCPWPLRDSLRLSCPDPDTPVLGSFSLGPSPCCHPHHLAQQVRGAAVSRAPWPACPGSGLELFSCSPGSGHVDRFSFQTYFCGMCVFLPVTTTFHLKCYLPQLLRVPLPPRGRGKAQPSPWCSQGYGDKSWGIVTSIRSKLAGRFRAEGKIICCSISNGLEMDLKGKFMPPITKARERTILRPGSLPGLHYPRLIPFLFSSVNEISWRRGPAGRLGEAFRSEAPVVEKELQGPCREGRSVPWVLGPAIISLISSPLLNTVRFQRLSSPLG